MVAPLIAPYVPTYAATQPYATAVEFNNYPTGVNSFEIVPGASQQIMADTLDQLLIEASSEADGICNQVLACTTEVEFGRRRVDSEGFLWVPTNQFPIVEVDALSVGLPGQMAPYLDLSGGAFPHRNVLRIPYTGTTDNQWVDVQITYLAGYPNAVTTTTSTLGATALTLSGVLGVQPGMVLRVYDPGASENVTVASVTGSTITLTAPLTAAHGTGVGVSALPAAIREAVLLLTAVKIKAKASQATTMQNLSGSIQSKPDVAPEQFSAAMDLLTPYVRV